MFWFFMFFVIKTFAKNFIFMNLIFFFWKFFVYIFHFFITTKHVKIDQSIAFLETHFLIKVYWFLIVRRGLRSKTNVFFKFFFDIFIFFICIQISMFYEFLYRDSIAFILLSIFFRRNRITFNKGDFNFDVFNIMCTLYIIINFIRIFNRNTLLPTFFVIGIRLKSKLKIRVFYGICNRIIKLFFF